MENTEAKPSIADLTNELDFLQPNWKKVGVRLGLSTDTLERIDKECRLNSQKLKKVIAIWIEEKQGPLLLPPIQRVLANADFIQQNERLKQLLNNAGVDRNNREVTVQEPIPQRSNRRGCSRGSTWSKCDLLTILVYVVAIGLFVGWRDDRLDSKEKFIAEAEEYVYQLLEEENREICILFTGKTGTGKSALVNGIISRNVTKEGRSLDLMTTAVEKFTRMVRGILMIVFDSPGLQDGTTNEKEYLLDVEKKCKEVDLVLYTLRMSDSRLHADDVEAMRKLTCVCGEQFWKKAMFVLTFANEVHDPDYPDDEASNMIFFEDKLNQWGKKLPQVLVQRLNVSKEVAECIPVVPAGYYKQPHLPGRRYWFSELWRKALNRMYECSADGYRLSLVYQKDRLKPPYEVTSEDFRLNLYEQPIVVPPGFMSTGKY